MTRMQPWTLDTLRGGPLAVLPEVPTRQEIEAFGAYLVSLEAEHGVVDLSTRHHYAEGVYGRSGVLQAGNFVVGMPHKHGCLNVVVGDITVWTEHGRQRLTGAHILSSTAGAPRVCFAHADTTWLTVHANPTNSTDVREIEDRLVEDAHRMAHRRHEGALQ